VQSVEAIQLLTNNSGAWSGTSSTDDFYGIKAVANARINLISANLSPSSACTNILVVNDSNYVVLANVSVSNRQGLFSNLVLQQGQVVRIIETSAGPAINCAGSQNHAFGALSNSQINVTAGTFDTTTFGGGWTDSGAFTWSIAYVVTSNDSAQAPNITLLYPDHPLNWSNGTVRLECTDTHLDTFNWTSSNPNMIEVSQTTNSTTSILELLFNSNVSGTVVPINATCRDDFGSVTSTLFTITFDVLKPYCYQNGLPIEQVDHAVPFATSYTWNDVTCYDELNLYSLNITCTGGSEFQFYTDNINSTSYNFSSSTLVVPCIS
jgi:hypothetical protein